eukprot:snap_masked-scaffold_43-processed-gene-1.59-mRNA-1 protein AED:1.00 eAED:1.00 QI:0/-1/0/0/-1/1/1/0/80
MNKTKVLLTKDGYNTFRGIADIDMNKVFLKYYCTRCEKNFHTQLSLNHHISLLFCDGTRNRSRVGILAVTDSKAIIQDRI